MAKMTWHYQVFKVVSKKKGCRPYYCIKEVYSGTNGLHSVEPMAPLADNEEGKKGVINVLEMMLKDAKHYPVRVEKVK